MRITTTLDPDVNSRLRAEARRTGKTFKQVVNENLRLGFKVLIQAKKAKPYVVKARLLGLRPGFSYDNIEKLLDKIEGPFHK